MTQSHQRRWIADHLIAQAILLNRLYEEVDFPGLLAGAINVRRRRVRAWLEDGVRPTTPNLRALQGAVDRADIVLRKIYGERTEQTQVDEPPLEDVLEWAMAGQVQLAPLWRRLGMTLEELLVYPNIFSDSEPLIRARELLASMCMYADLVADNPEWGSPPKPSEAQGVIGALLTELRDTAEGVSDAAERASLLGWVNVVEGSLADLATVEDEEELLGWLRGFRIAIRSLKRSAPGWARDRITNAVDSFIDSGLGVVVGIAIGRML